MISELFLLSLCFKPKKYFRNYLSLITSPLLKSRTYKKGKRKVQGVPQSQTAALPRPQEEEETDKSTQIEQMYEKH